MRTSLLFLLSLLFSITSFGKVITINKAQTFAKNFYTQHYNVSHEAQLKSVIFEKEISYKEKNLPIYYIFNVEKEAGFIIISAEDATLPVLAYSFEGSFYANGLNEASDVFMKKYADQIRMTRESRLPQSKEIKAKWDEYLSPQGEAGNFAFATPLITTKWDQDCYYNLYAPIVTSGPCSRTYIGCVATAMAQIMKYYDFPTTGYGTHSYTDPNFGLQSANFGATTYNWSQMPTQLAYGSPLVEKQAVSRLMTDCGISVDMQYSANGSGTTTAFTPDAFSDYFRYDYAATQIAADDYTSSQWQVILTDQINNNHPVLYSGTDYSIGYGHAWVMDGYQGSYFHMNWGWSGYNNGYFILTNLSTSSYSFTDDQEAVINIFPSSSGCSNGATLFSKTGRIEDGSGVSNYSNNLNCSWLINPPAANVVTLSFDEFNTESGVDIVKIYDGISASSTLIGTYSGANLPSLVIANSGSMYITFTTNGSVNKSGWKAHWNDKLPIFCNNLTFLTSATSTFDDGSGKNNYLNNSQCKWLIKPSGASHVNLVFKEFDLHSTDHLYVYNGSNTNAPLLGSFTGSNLPQDLQSSGNSMLLYFVTNNSGVSKGWKVSFYKNGVLSINNSPKNNEIKLYPNPANNKLNIEIEKEIIGKISLEIMDIQGRIIKSFSQTTLNLSSVFSLDISDISQGYYFLRLMNGDIIITHPFLKN